MEKDLQYKRYMCVICGFVYNEAEGCLEAGVESGTLWQDVPEDFCCPDCGAIKEDFEMLEVDWESDEYDEDDDGDYDDEDDE